MLLQNLNRLEKDLVRDEGFKLKPYKDTKGILTIGVGRNLEENGISEDEAVFMLRNDIEKCKKELSQFEWYNLLSDNRKDVIVNMCFNLGLTKLLKFEKMIKAICQNNYHAASLEMLNSKWADDVKDRAIRLSKIMELG